MYDTELRKFCLERAIHYRALRQKDACPLEDAERFFQWLKNGKGELRRSEQIERNLLTLVDGAFKAPNGRGGLMTVVNSEVLEDLERILKCQPQEQEQGE